MRVKVGDFLNSLCNVEGVEEMTPEQFYEKLKEFNIELTEEQKWQLNRYYELLVEWNEKNESNRYYRN